ncbi:MAG TPA: RNA ligase family protein, partial [Cyclobacteriaceae bacterium]|nr:RNA ligase family protein [Cyclobacteriaceae bacterium]
MEFKLLHRDDFRNQIFARDKHKCVICKVHAVDAHHIIERRLFTDGGYYLENGASLCETCHIKAEETTISCDRIREACGIIKFPIPEHFYEDLIYDKWGNIILTSGERLKGELFFDESVQKILKQGNMLDLFQKYVKYPRTYHLPGSHLLKDDRQLVNDDCFKGKEVVVTLKMDGENTSMYNDYIHARSLDFASRVDRSYIKQLWSQVCYLIDEDMRVCGENLYAKHSLHYTNLSSYFMTFSVWIETLCLSWDETVEYSKILGLDTVPVIYRGLYDAKKISETFFGLKEVH